MWFFFAAIVFMLVARKIGWWLSRAFFYETKNDGLAITGTVVWGIVVALCISRLIEYQHPGTIMKWIFGFALGAYVAIPNYGLFNASSIPYEAARRHNLISNVPFVTYILAEVAARWA